MKVGLCESEGEKHEHGEQAEQLTHYILQNLVDGISNNLNCETIVKGGRQGLTKCGASRSGSSSGGESSWQGV